MLSETDMDGFKAKVQYTLVQFFDFFDLSLGMDRNSWDIDIKRARYVEGLLHLPCSFS